MEEITFNCKLFQVSAVILNFLPTATSYPSGHENSYIGLHAGYIVFKSVNDLNKTSFPSIVPYTLIVAVKVSSYIFLDLSQAMYEFAIVVLATSEAGMVTVLVLLVSNI